MDLRHEWLRFGDGGRWSGYFAAAARAAPPTPAIVVFQEAWGVDAHIEDVVCRLATAGYAVLAPDLFATHGTRTPGLERERLAETQQFLNGLPPGAWGDPAARDRALSDRAPAEAARIRDTLGTLFAPGGPLGAEQHLPIARAAIEYLRLQPLTEGAPLATIGFCMGGSVSALVGCHDPAVRLAVIFYGSSPAADLAARACPMLGFYGGADTRVNATVPAFAEAMARAGRPFETHTYPDVPHAFFNDTRPSYHPAAARDAFARTLVALAGL